MAPNIRELSPELQKRAIKELNEVPERREQDIAAIREWLKKQPHILAKPDDQTIIAFLRGCKFSLEKTKEKMDLYYTIRTALPEFFTDRNIKDAALREMLELGGSIALPGLHKDGYRIFIMRMGLGDIGKFKIEQFFKLNFMLQDYMIREDDEALINGGVAIVDSSQFRMAHLTLMNPVVMKKVTIASQEAYPFRPKGLHYINNPKFIGAMFNLFETFLKEKLRKRLYVHGDNLEALYKQIPQHLLPEEYGGKAGTLKELNDAYIAKLEAYNDWFLSPEGYLGVDESKRPGKPKTYEDLFGIEGSFRQLNVD